MVPDLLRGWAGLAVSSLHQALDWLEAVPEHIRGYH